MVRLATHDDASAIADLIGLFVATLPLYKAAPFDHGDAVITSEYWMAQEYHFGYVQEKDGVIVGFISGCTQPCPWNLELTFGHQLAYFVDPKHRSRDSLKLLDVFEKHCKDAGAIIVNSGAKYNSEAEAMDKMLTRRGYARSENHYLKGV